MARRLRPGNGGANNTTDVIERFHVAWANLPELPDEVAVVVRTDSAAASHRLVDHAASAEPSRARTPKRRALTAAG